MPLSIAATDVISTRGSTRATRYSGTNKIVTLDDKTHVAWLDSVSETVVATFDAASGRWTGPFRVGTGADNHGGPALACDSRGHLHVVFGPHVGPFQHCVSARPNDASEWVRRDDFGDRATYPSLVCDEADTLHIIYRGGPSPHRLVYQRRPANGRWSAPRALAAAPIESGYTHYHAALSIAPDGTLHAAYDIFHDGAAKCAGHLLSRDGGTTWLLADGSAPDLPVTPDHDAFFTRSATPLKVHGVTCDSAGQPWIPLSGTDLFTHDGKHWRRIALDAVPIAPAVTGTLRTAGPCGIDTRDRLYLPATVDGALVLLVSGNRGASFRALSVFPRDPKLPHWGFTLERPTGHNRVTLPWLLFSTGLKGPDCFGRGIFHTVRAVRLTSRAEGTAHE